MEIKMSVVEKLKEKLENTVFDGTEKAIWREYMAHCFRTRQLLGFKEKNLNHAKAQPTEALVSRFRDYKKLCVSKAKNIGGKTFVLYGPRGSGKSQTVLSFVQGSCPWNPDRGIFVNPRGTTRTGNEYMEALSSALSYRGKPRDLAEELVQIATNPSPYQQPLSAVGGCCDDIKQIDQSHFIRIVPAAPETENFDKFPVIALDNVKFQFNKGDSLAVKDHGDFFNFIHHLFELACGSNVVVFLTTSNLYLAEELVILNGCTKIVPASASIAVDSTEDHWLQESMLQNGELVTFQWRKGLGWTKQSTHTFLKREFPHVPSNLIEVAVDTYWSAGNIRGAIEMVNESYPSLRRVDTSKSH